MAHRPHNARELKRAQEARKERGRQVRRDKARAAEERAEAARHRKHKACHNHKVKLPQQEMYHCMSPDTPMLHVYREYGVWKMWCESCYETFCFPGQPPGWGLTHP